MLTGRFGNTSGRPYIEGRLIFSNLGIKSDISFCMDTGADRSLLLPNDGLRMGIDYTKLTGVSESVGIGGVCRNYVEPVLLVFSDPGRALYVYELDLAVAMPSQEIMDIPSLLGRDILNRWQINYNPTKNRLTCQVISADVVIPLLP